MKQIWNDPVTILRIEGTFMLPPEFAGTAAEALRLLASHLEAPTECPYTQFHFTYDSGWSAFVWNVDMGEAPEPRWTGKLAIGRLVPGEGWASLPDGVVNASRELTREDSAMVK